MTTGQRHADIPPRLHVLLSRDGRSALVIRRGPSKRVCTFGWDRTRDEFSVGQWLYGRIYERRCDLSPDGKYFIYFAMNGRWEAETGGAWTAISRAPFLKAITLWAKGDCWNGGGIFTANDRYWLNDGYGHRLLHEAPKPTRDGEYRPEGLGNNECLGIYYPRLLRDGWRLVESRRSGAEATVDLFEKQLPRGWVLRKSAFSSINHPIGRGVYYDQHSLHNPKEAVALDFPSWEWAEFESGRLVWAEEGKLKAGELAKQGLGQIRELHDFNRYAYQRIKAPY